jgi:two-component system sensor kinase FixL
LNQPLAAILSNAQAAVRFLDQGPLDVNELRETLSDIIDDDRRASEVIKRVRALMTRKETKREAFEIGSLLRQTLELLRNELLLQRVTSRLELDSRPPWVTADRIQVQQIVLNLLINGIDAVAEREPAERRVTLSSQHDDSHVTISVRDSGRGIAESRLPTLFEPFNSSKPDGLGMGLTVCRDLVEAHGGQIWMADTSSTGTIMSFRLPIDGSEQP